MHLNDNPTKTKDSNDKLSKLKEAGITSIIIGIIILSLTRDFLLFIKLFLGFMIIMYIPGYALACLLLKDWNRLEKSIIALFLGMGPTAILAYIFSAFGIPAVSIWFALIVAAISGFFIWRDISNHSDQ